MAYKAQDFIAVIPGSRGIVSEIARRVGCDWNTAHKYIEEHPTVRQAYENEIESTLDLHEKTIHDAAIEQGDVSTAKWYLTKKGKHRGYGDDPAVTVTNELTLIWPEEAADAD